MEEFIEVAFLIMFFVYSIISSMRKQEKDKNVKRTELPRDRGGLSSGPIIIDKDKYYSARKSKSSQTARTVKTASSSVSKQTVILQPDSDNVFSYDNRPAYDTGIDYDRDKISPLVDLHSRPVADLKKQKTMYDLDTIDVRQLLRNPKTLGEVILLSEVLRRPRALSRKF